MRVRIYFGKDDKKMDITCERMIDQGNVGGNGRRWFTLEGVTESKVDTTKKSGIVGYRIDDEEIRKTRMITVNPLTNNAIDLYIE